MVIKMDEVTQYSAALLELAVAGVHFLDERTTNLNAAMCAFRLAGERWSLLPGVAGRSERLRTGEAASRSRRKSTVVCWVESAGQGAIQDAGTQKGIGNLTRGGAARRWR